MRRDGTDNIVGLRSIFLRGPDSSADPADRLILIRLNRKKIR